MAKRTRKKSAARAKICSSAKRYSKKIKSAVRAKKGLLDKALKFLGL